MEEKTKSTLVREDRKTIKIKNWPSWSLILFLVFLVWPQITNAATLILAPTSVTTKSGSTFNITVAVESSTQSMNAASGTISFPTDKLEVTSVSKSSSIISLWVQEPSFDNSSGEVLFEGIVLNPGYKGASGRLISISFKTKAAGSADIIFRAGSILANDGKGTNILTGLGKVAVKIDPVVVGPQAPESTTPVETTGGVPLAPKVSSSSHPDPDKWYKNNNPTFGWTMPAGITGVNVLADRNPNTNPGTISDGLRSSYTFNNVEDGIWYFHIRLRNNAGWGAITHFRFQVDTVAPEQLVLEFPEGEATANPRPIVVIKTKDTLSGVSYYKILINNEKIEVPADKLINGNSYQLPLLKPGAQTVLVQAFDKAGNETAATGEFTIVALEPTVLTDYPQELSSNEILTVKGKTAYTNSQITLWLKPDQGDLLSQIVSSDNQGNFTIVYKERLPEGIYQIWTTVQNELGAISGESKKITLAIKLPSVLKFGKIALDYLTLMTTIILLIIGIVVIVVYSWYRVSYWRRKIAKISKTTKATEEGLRKAFITLRDQLENQISKLDGKPGLSTREKQICDKLKQSLQASEKFLEKELSDIEKQLDK